MVFTIGHKINIGRKFSKDRNLKISIAKKGFKHSQESIEKMKMFNGDKSSNWKGGNRKCFRCGKQLSYRSMKRINPRCRKCYHSDPKEIEDRRKRNLKDKSHFWKGGTTTTAKHIKNLPEYHNWRMEIFKRDNFTCVFCGVNSNMGVELNADHIIPFSFIVNKEIEKYGIENLFIKIKDCELLFNINNGRTLCRSCHLKTDTWGHKAKKYGQKD